MKRSRYIAVILLLASLSCRNNSSPISQAPSPVPASSTPPLFQEVAESTGLQFHHFAGATKQMYFPELMGSGVALLDYNNDGALDIFLVQGDLVDPHQNPADVLFPRPSADKLGCRLFRNDLSKTGKLHFTDVTEQAGLGHLNLGAGMGVAVGDYDNDGWPDMYVTGYGKSILLHNNGHGGFTDVTTQAGVGDYGNWAASAAFVDYDQDGKLDLIVATYVNFTVATNQKCFAVSGPPDYCGPTSYKGVPARLYHNLGGGRFEDVTKRSGLGAVPGPGLGVACADLDGDGWVDIFVANDQSVNTLWLNQRNGTFKESAVAAGCATNQLGRPQANMGIAMADIDNKGSDDILLTHLSTEGATLFRNDGKANFQDVTAHVSLGEKTLPLTGFGTDWFDYDNDGRLDLFVTNGAVATIEAQRGKTPWPFQQTNQLFHNEGPGQGFRETTAAAGPALGLQGVGRGAAFGDLDNDGRVDIVVSNNNGPARLLLNQAPKQNHWLELHLEGNRSNRMGLGARVGCERKGQPTLWIRCHTDGSYLSSSDSRIHFGLGPSPTVQAIVVQWPNGSRERWEGIQPDKVIILREGTGKRDNTAH